MMMIVDTLDHFNRRCMIALAMMNAEKARAAEGAPTIDPRYTGEE